MSQSAEELKVAYDKAVQMLVARYQAQVIKGVLEIEGEDSSASIHWASLNIDQFFEENVEALRELNHEERMKLVQDIASAH